MMCSIEYGLNFINNLNRNKIILTNKNNRLKNIIERIKKVFNFLQKKLDNPLILTKLFLLLPLINVIKRQRKTQIQ